MRKEVSKEYIKQLPIGTTYYVYNPLTDTTKEETASPIDIAHSKYAYEKLRYYVEEE